jgi:hypothetical protein
MWSNGSHEISFSFREIVRSIHERPLLRQGMAHQDRDGKGPTNLKLDDIPFRANSACCSTSIAKHVQETGRKPGLVLIFRPNNRHLDEKDGSARKIKRDEEVTES